MNIQQPHTRIYGGMSTFPCSDDLPAASTSMQYNPDEDPYFAPLPPIIPEQTAEQREFAKARITAKDVRNRKKRRRSSTTFVLAPVNTPSQKLSPLSKSLESQFGTVDRILRIEEQKRKQKKIMMAVLRRKALQKIQDAEQAAKIKAWFARPNKMFTQYSTVGKSWSSRYTWKGASHLVVYGNKLPNYSRAAIIKRHETAIMRWLISARESLRVKYIKAHAQKDADRQRGLHFAHRRNGGGKKGRRNNKGVSAWTGFNPKVEAKIAEAKKIQKAESKKAQRAAKPEPRRVPEPTTYVEKKPKAKQFDNFAGEEESDEEEYEIPPAYEEPEVKSVEKLDPSGMIIEIIGNGKVNINLLAQKIDDKLQHGSWKTEYGSECGRMKAFLVSNSKFTVTSSGEVSVTQGETSEWTQVNKKARKKTVIELGFMGNKNLAKLRARNEKNRRVCLPVCREMGHKNIPCRSLQTGTPCKYGASCKFAHTRIELTIIKTCVYGDSCKFQNSKDKCCYFQHPNETKEGSADRIWNWTVGKVPKPINLTKVFRKPRQPKKYVAPSAPWTKKQSQPRRVVVVPTKKSPRRVVVVPTKKAPRRVVVVPTKKSPRKVMVVPTKKSPQLAQPMVSEKHVEKSQEPIMTTDEERHADRNMRRIAFYSRKIASKCRNPGCLGNGLHKKGICRCVKDVKSTGRERGDEKCLFPFPTPKCRCENGCVHCRGSGNESIMSQISSQVSRKFGAVEMGQSAEQLMREMTYMTARSAYYSETQISQDGVPLTEVQEPEEIARAEMANLLAMPEKKMVEIQDDWKEDPGYYFTSGRTMASQDDVRKANVFQPRYRENKLSKKEFLEQRLSCIPSLIAEQEAIVALNQPESGFTCPNCGRSGTIAHCGGSGIDTFASFQDGYCVHCAKTDTPVLLEIKTRNERSSKGTGTYAGNFIGLQVLRRKRFTIVLVILSRDTGNIRWGVVDSCRARAKDEFCNSVQRFVAEPDFQIADASAPGSIINCSTGMTLSGVQAPVDKYSREFCEDLKHRLIESVDLDKSWETKITTRQWTGYCKQ